MNDKTANIQEIKTFLQNFVDARDWKQFHDPKNLSMLIATEASEIMEIFRWVDNAQSDEYAEKKRSEIEHEVADVFFGLLIFCNRCNIDLSKALHEKMKVNAKRYPVEKAKGKATKYTEL